MIIIVWKKLRIMLATKEGISVFKENPKRSLISFSFTEFLFAEENKMKKNGKIFLVRKFLKETFFLITEGNFLGRETKKHIGQGRKWDISSSANNKNMKKLMQLDGDLRKN